MVRSDTDTAIEAAILVLQDIRECPHCNVCASAAKAVLELMGNLDKKLLVVKLSVV